MRPKYLVAVHAFFIDKNDKILLSKRQNTSYMDDWYSVPAGHVEAMEPVDLAMKREIVEEIGLKVELKEPQHIMQRLSPNNERIDYFYVIRQWQGEISNQEPEKCSELAWFNLSELPTNTIPYIRKALEEVSAKRPFCIFFEPQ